jgi:hypothetical protein
LVQIALALVTFRNMCPGRNATDASRNLQNP